MTEPTDVRGLRERIAKEVRRLMLLDLFLIVMSMVGAGMAVIRYAGGYVIIAALYAAMTVGAGLIVLYHPPRSR